MHIVIVWAWGSWISNLAHIIWDLWYKNLIAIDSQESQITTALKEKWIPVKIGHWKYDIKDDDIVMKYKGRAITYKEFKDGTYLQLS